MLKCNSCGGTYPDTTKGGVTYFHACPDEIIDQPEQLNDKNEIAKPATRKPTPNPRNENLKQHPERPSELVMLSEGNGVTELD